MAFSFSGWWAQALWSLIGTRLSHAFEQAVFADLLAVLIGLANLFTLLKDGHAVMVSGIRADRNTGAAGPAGGLCRLSFRLDAVDHALHQFGAGENRGWHGKYRSNE
jgi:hypothetical protein